MQSYYIDKDDLNKSTLKTEVYNALRFYIVKVALGIARLWAYKHCEKKATSPELGLNGKTDKMWLSDILKIIRDSSAANN